MAHIELTLGTADQPAVIVCVGEIDMDDTERINNAVTDGLVGQPSALQIDLADVTFVDSTGLATLIKARRTCEERGVGFALSRPSAPVSRILELTRLTESFTINNG
jgi:anti-sigma B factor antagonist